GRSPNDLPATYQISFGGGFAAITGQESPDAPVVESAVSGEVAVNSVGTILPNQPKKEAARTEPQKPAETVSEARRPSEEGSKSVESVKPEAPKEAEEKPAEATRARERRTKRRPKVVVTETVEPRAEAAAKPSKKKAEKRPRRTAKKEK